MRLKRERISTLAGEMISQLRSDRLIRFEAPASEMAALLEQVIVKNLVAEDELDAEVRKILDSYETAIRQGNVDERKMFLMIKKQIAKEKGVVL